MEIRAHKVNGERIAEILSDDIVIADAGDGLDLLGDLYYQEFDRIIVHERNIIPEFFDLKTGIAGEILQKFSNYRVRLAIVGNFDAYQGKSIRDFMLESNKAGQINFVDSTATALERLA
ncbi:DUF4180 domain-containing protein [Olivibacter sitiensis]|uniref:DUF4180 domain-containing protein n=1 Tax=Olivibacter sitiensis TaxID=376470 RepID=UPI0004251DA6|nr:DUF4180 domain-containing protein [Olivibacter sitiensis]